MRCVDVDHSFKKQQLDQFDHAINKYLKLVDGFEPLQNISQTGNFPQIGVKKNIFETTT